MAEIKKYLDTTALGTLVEQIKAEDAKVKAYADSQIEAAGKGYDVAGAAATAESNAKAYTDQLAQGAVAGNTAAIAKLNGDANTDGSVAKAVADAQATLQGSINAVDAIADKNAEDIAAINNAETGILKQAKDYADTEDAKIESEVGSLADLVGVIPEGYEATTIAEYAKELADNVAANGYDDTALAGRVSKNETDIAALKEKDAELVQADEDLQAAIDAVKEDVDAFFLDADMTESAKDTLKELQQYISSDETAASQMAASIKANSDAIDLLETADAAQDEKIAALEAAVGDSGSVAQDIEEAKQAAITAAAQDATTKANAAEAAAKGYTDTEVGKDRARLDALEADTHTHANKALLDTYTQTETDLADAVAKKHAHANAEVLDGITAAQITAWDAAEANAKAHANSLNSTMDAKVNGIDSRVGTLESTIADKAEADDLTAAVARIAANEAAIAANTSAINSFSAITSDEVEALFA